MYKLTSKGVALHQQHALTALRKENAVLLGRLDEYQQRVNTIVSDMNTLRHTARDIQVSAALPGGEIAYGVGGPNAEPDKIRPETPTAQTIAWNLSSLESEVRMLKVNMTDMEKNVASRRDRIASYPSIRPVRGGWISSAFGMRIDPFTDRFENHPGVDISVRNNTDVMASAAGVVKAVRKNAIGKKGYGKYIIIDHGYGNETLYAHLSKVLVKEGQKVNRWDVIGLSGNTGKSTAPHLHYGVFVNGKAQDPLNFILE